MSLGLTLDERGGVHKNLLSAPILSRIPIQTTVSKPLVIRCTPMNDLLHLPRLHAPEDHKPQPQPLVDPRQHPVEVVYPRNV